MTVLKRCIMCLIPLESNRGQGYANELQLKVLYTLHGLPFIQM